MPLLYPKLIIPGEVVSELRADISEYPEYQALIEIKDQIRVLDPHSTLPTVLTNQLDLGEASVIHTALQANYPTVAIDEKAGRRVARIHGLKVTGSLGILLKGKEHGHIDSIGQCIQRMKAQGVWISPELIKRALDAAGES